MDRNPNRKPLLDSAGARPPPNPGPAPAPHRPSTHGAGGQRPGDGRPEPTHVVTVLGTNCWPELPRSCGTGNVRPDNMDEWPEPMREWLALHGRARALLEIQPPEMPDFQHAPPSQNLLQPDAPVAASQGAPDQPSILEHWRPQWLPALLADEAHLRVRKDVCQRPATMAEEIAAFRTKVDQSFGWKGKVLNEQQRNYRAAAQATMLSPGCMPVITHAHAVCSIIVCDLKIFIYNKYSNNTK